MKAKHAASRTSSGNLFSRLTTKSKIIVIVVTVLVIGAGSYMLRAAVNTRNINVNTVMMAPRASGEKSKIAYVKDYKIYSANLNGTDTKVIFEPADQSNYAIIAKASPDGSKVAMLRDNRLYIMNADGSHNQQIINEEVLNFVWAPQGDYLLYSWQQYPAGHKKFADDPGDFTCVKGGDGCAERFTMFSIKSGKNQSVQTNANDMEEYYEAAEQRETAPFKRDFADPVDGNDYDPYKSDDYFSREFGPQNISLHNDQTGADTVLLTSKHQPYYELVGVLPGQNMFVIKFNNKQSPIMNLEKRELDGSQPITLASSDLMMQFVGGLK